MITIADQHVREYNAKLLTEMLVAAVTPKSDPFIMGMDFSIGKDSCRIGDMYWDGKTLHIKTLRGFVDCGKYE